MSRSQLEVAEVFHRYHQAYLTAYSASPDQRKVMANLMACRSALLGGHLWRCQRCGHEKIAYNSCRNRHCPTCQASKQAEWLQAQCANLLQVPYYHMVFTLPHQLCPLAMQNKSLLYGLLFQSASQSLMKIALDPGHLGAHLGFTAILHTWGQTLMHHPHVHCLIPAGGLSPDMQCWIPARKQFFLPVRVLSRLFRGLYLRRLQNAWRQGELLLTGRLDKLTGHDSWQALLNTLYQTEWVVYGKPAFGSPEQVLKYLARYTHRVAISNQRLLCLEEEQVSFRYKDYRRGHQWRTMRLSAVEFIRRFLLHTLPKGFVRIRHYGFLANRVRQEKLALCRRLLIVLYQREPPSGARAGPAEVPVDRGHERCPACKQGRMHRVGILPPARAGPVYSLNRLAYA